MSLHNYIHWLDYGVKGQMRGKHLMARDPEYLARLKVGLAKHNVSKVVPTRPTVNNVSVRNLTENVKSKARKKARERLSSDDVLERKRGEALYNKIKRRREQGMAFLEGRHEAKKKRRELQEAKRQNRRKWIKRGKIGAVLGGLGLIGAGIGYAKHKGAFDSNYNVLNAKSSRRIDYGVKGQKKGQHVKAHDPEYLARLKGGKASKPGHFNITKLNEGKMSNVDYSKIGLNNASIRNAERKRNELVKEFKNASSKGKTIPTNKASKLFRLETGLGEIKKHRQNVSANKTSRAKALAGYEEAMNKYNRNQKLLRHGLTNEVMKKPELPKEIVNYENKQNQRKAKKLENQKAAKLAKTANKKNILSRIGEGLKKHKGKAMLAGLGLTALGTGISYAKKKGAFDSNYELLRIKRNINRLQNRRHKDALTIKRLKKYNDLSVKQKATIAIAAPFVGIPLAIALEKFVLTPLSHKMDIRDIYEGRWREKEFVSYIKSEYRRKSDKFWKWIAEPGIEPQTYSEADYQKMKNLVMGAQTARDLSRLFPKNNFLKEAADAFEFRKKLKKQI